MVRVRIYHIQCIYIHLEKNVDLKTGFLRILFWRFIEVKRIIQHDKVVKGFSM